MVLACHYKWQGEVPEVALVPWDQETREAYKSNHLRAFAGNCHLCVPGTSPFWFFAKEARGEVPEDKELQHNLLRTIGKMQVSNGTLGTMLQRAVNARTVLRLMLAMPQLDWAGAASKVFSHSRRRPAHMPRP